MYSVVMGSNVSRSSRQMRFGVVMTASPSQNAIRFSFCTSMRMVPSVPSRSSRITVERANPAVVRRSRSTTLPRKNSTEPDSDRNRSQAPSSARWTASSSPATLLQ